MYQNYHNGIEKHTKREVNFTLMSNTFLKRLSELVQTSVHRSILCRTSLLFRLTAVPLLLNVFLCGEQATGPAPKPSRKIITAVNCTMTVMDHDTKTSIAGFPLEAYLQDDTNFISLKCTTDNSGRININKAQIRDLSYFDITTNDVKYYYQTKELLIDSVGSISNSTWIVNDTFSITKIGDSIKYSFRLFVEDSSKVDYPFIPNANIQVKFYRKETEVDAHVTIQKDTAYYDITARMSYSPVELQCTFVATASGFVKDSTMFPHTPNDTSRSDVFIGLGIPK